MSKTNNKSTPIPGIETDKVPGVQKDKDLEVNVDNVLKWMKDDTRRAINMLHAILEDERVQKLLAEHFYSKWYNQKHAHVKHVSETETPV